MGLKRKQGTIMAGVTHKTKLTEPQKQLKELQKQARKRAELEKRAAFRSWCETQGLPEPVHEFEFAISEGRKWRIDWYFEHDGKKLAVEVEGGVARGGRHNRPTGFMKDMEKYNSLPRYGITLYRVIPKTLFNFETANFIRSFFGLPLPVDFFKPKSEKNANSLQRK